jgi:multicomponent Na+:H+ antiporter subunit E
LFRQATGVGTATEGAERAGGTNAVTSQRRNRRRPPGSADEQRPLRRFAALAIWAFAVWLLLTWTATAEQLTFGAILAVLVAAALSPLGDVVAPWRLADPRRAGAVLALAASALMRIVRANLSLARRIWTPSRPLRSGMLVVPTQLRSDGGIAVTGLVTSLIVDNQIVDLDRSRNELQYHAVSVPTGSKRNQSEAVNAPVERLIARIERPGRSPRGGSERSSG